MKVGKPKGVGNSKYRSKKGTDKTLPITADNVDLFSQELENSLKYDSRYSLVPDPDGTLGLTDIQKDFITLYVEHRSMNVCSTALGLSIKDTFDISKDAKVKEEIKRINLAHYFRTFHNKTLTLDEAGGYLKSLIVDDVPEYQRIKSKDKLRAIELSIKIQEIKAAIIKEPAKMDFIDAETIKEDVKDLNVKDIKRLIAETDKIADDKRMPSKDQMTVMEKKNLYINEIQKRNKGEIDSTDKAYLRSLSLKELEDIIIADEEINVKRMRTESLERELEKQKETQEKIQRGIEAMEAVRKRKEEALKAEEERNKKLEEIGNRGIVPQDEEE